MAHDVKFEFKARNEQAIAAAETNAARLVTAVSDETKNAIRNIVSRSIREGIPPREAAKMIRGSIGLDSTQTAGAANYRAELKLSGLSEERIDKAYEFYTAKKIRERSVRIARTEVLGALNAGSLESWKQAQRDGLLPANARKKWIVTNDELLRQCPVCRPMNGQEQPFGKKFVLPNGKKIMFPPAHPNCRCTMGDPSKGPRKVTRLLDFLNQETPSWLTEAAPLSIEHIALEDDAFHVNDVFDMILRDTHGLKRAIFKPPTNYGDEDDSSFVTDSGRMIQFTRVPEALREVLAFAIGRVLGVPVPATTMRTFSAAVLQKFPFGPQGKTTGMIQRFLTNSLPINLAYSSAVNGIPYPELSDHKRDGFTIFDYLIGNGDRHGGNLMLELPGLDNSTLRGFGESIRHGLQQHGVKVWGIDHGFAFENLPGMHWGPNAIEPWWRENHDDMGLGTGTGGWREMTKDSSDYWMTELGEKKEQMIDLLQDSMLELQNKNATLNRLATVMGAIRLKKLGFLFRQTFSYAPGRGPR